MKFACITVVKNAEKSIAEWLAFHLAIGVDTIFVLDNASTDATVEVVEQFSGRFDVRLAHWPLTSADYQIQGFLRAVEECRADFDWCAFIDIDEFIMLPPGRTLAEVVDVPATVSAIAMNWAMFGSSGHVARPPGLVIENYLHRADLTFPHNRMLKTIARPADVRGCRSTHIFRVTGDYVDMTHQPVDSTYDHIEHLPDYSGGRLNHYFAQSREDWQAKVVTRGYHDIERSQDDFARFDRNDIFDDSALSVVPKVKEIIEAALTPPVRLVKR
ncbi:glycosyltransferase family 2 protein [Rhizobium sp.]